MRKGLALCEKKDCDDQREKIVKVFFLMSKRNKNGEMGQTKAFQCAMLLKVSTD